MDVLELCDLPLCAHVICSFKEATLLFEICGGNDDFQAIL